MFFSGSPARSASGPRAQGKGALRAPWAPSGPKGPLGPLGFIPKPFRVDGHYERIAITSGGSFCLDGGLDPKCEMVQNERLCSLGPKCTEIQNQYFRTYGRLESEIYLNCTKTYHLECLVGLGPNDPFKHFGHKFGLQGLSRRHLPMALSLAWLSQQYLPKVRGTFRGC